MVLGDRADARAFVRCRQAQAGCDTRIDRVVARRPAEDEEDGRQQVLLGQPLDHLDASRREEPSPRQPPRPMRTQRIGIEAIGLGVGATVDEGRQQVQLWRRAIADAVQVDEFDGPAILDHRGRRPAHRRDPVGELFRIRDGRRQADEPDIGGQVEDHLLPHGPAIGVLEVVDLVEHDEPQPVERRGLGVDHVAQHFGRHDDDGRVAVHRVVAGQQANAIGAVPPGQIAVLLVRERLDRRGVEDLSPCRQREGDGVLRDDRLTRAGWRGDEHGLTGVERVEGADLKGVEREVVGRAESVSGLGHLVLAADRLRRRSRTQPNSTARP